VFALAWERQFLTTAETFILTGAAPSFAIMLSLLIVAIGINQIGNQPQSGATES